MNMMPKYERQGVRLFHGDCADVLAALAPVRADLIITSPPYDGIRDYEGASAAYDFHRCAAPIAAALTDGGVMAWHTNDGVVNGGYTNTSLKAALHFCEDLGLVMHDRIIVDRMGLGAFAADRWFQNWDYCWILSKGKPKTFNALEGEPNVSEGKVRRNRVDGLRNADGAPKLTFKTLPATPKTSKRRAIWRINSGSQAQAFHGDISHPAPMPMRLAQDLISAYSNPDDLVLDPFAGSGTAAYAAMMMGRRAIGIEVHKPYLDEAIERRFAQLPLVGVG